MAGNFAVTGTVTYSSQTNRDAALTRVNSALAAYSYISQTTAFPGGVNTSGTTVITFSLVFTDSTIDNANACMSAIHTATTSSNRWTSGWISVGAL